MSDNVVEKQESSVSLAGMLPRRRALIALGAVALTGTGCAMWRRGQKASWSGVTLVASADANENSPVAVDIVLVRDPVLLEKLAVLPAKKWFEVRKEWRETYPRDIRWHGWEIVPSQRLSIPGKVFSGPRVAGAFVFANYQRPGAHRIAVDRFAGRLIVQLDKDDFSVVAKP